LERRREEEEELGVVTRKDQEELHKEAGAGAH